jgi:hypothetical protein
MLFLISSSQNFLVRFRSNDLEVCFLATIHAELLYLNCGRYTSFKIYKEQLFQILLVESSSSYYSFSILYSSVSFNYFTKQSKIY